MSLDTRINLNNGKFEQISSDVLSLSGCTKIYGDFEVLSGATIRILPNASLGKYFVSDEIGNGSWQNFAGIIGAGDGITKRVEQTSHGFNLNVVVGWSNNAYDKPIADGSYDGEILGIVSKCYNADCFDLTQAGYVTGLTSLSVNSTYFLSDITPGLLSPTKPTIVGHIVKSVIVADSSTSGWVLPYPGYVLATSTGSTGNSSLSEFMITGDSITTGFTVNHARNKQFVVVEIINNGTPFNTVYTSVQRPNANCVYVSFDTAPTTGQQYRILIIN